MSPEPHTPHLYFRPEAAALAGLWRERFVLEERESPPVGGEGFYIWAAADHLELRRRGASDRAAAGAWVSCDEIRRRAGRRSDLAKACGAGAGRAPRVLDVMGGWGVDGLELAFRGCPVTLIERDPRLHALQHDLIRRLGVEASARLDDGYRVLRNSPACDVVYLDPMFPERGKRALPGKRMQFLAELSAADHRPLEQWLQAAVATARMRVVVKRRLKDPTCAPPHWQIRGRTVRYDVYRGEAGARQYS
ncbi:MAG: class I SAM-dependent methyltransferase [Pseudomonadota bacterium]